MSEGHDNTTNIKEYLYVRAETDANSFNLKSLAVLCLFIILCEALNTLGVFKVPSLVMHICTASEIIILSTPLIIYLIHDKLQKHEKSILRAHSFKHIIILCTYLGIALVCVALSFHAVILLAIPPLVIAQYKYQKNIFIWCLVVTIVLCLVSVYGSFFFGTLDRNFVKGLMTDEEFSVLANRIELASSGRMWELFTHYVIPRGLGTIAIILLVTGVTRRNGRMLEQQEKLDKQVNQVERVNKLQRQVIDSLATLIETREIGTGEHVIRTKRYVRILADAMKEHEKYKDYLTDERIGIIEGAAPLHDVGKIVVSDTILLKPGKLTPEEFEAMKIHTTKGGKVIRDIFDGMENDEFLHLAEQIATSHHEKWDGSGYPQGLKGEEIPLVARIMAVADVFDALISVRSYKKSIPPEEAINIMLSESGTHFDPEIMKIVEQLRDKLIDESKRSLEQIKDENIKNN